MKDKKFTFFESYHKALSRLSDEHYGRIVRAISKFVFDGEEPDFSEDTDWVIWELTKPIIERGFEISNARKEANLSRKSFSGGAPLGNRNSAKQQQTTTKQQQTTTDMDKDKDNEMEWEGEQDALTPPQLEDVVLYFDEHDKGKASDPNKFFSHFDSLGWVSNGQPIVNWQSRADMWISEDIKKSAGKPPSEPFVLKRLTKEEYEEREAKRQESEYENFKGVIDLIRHNPESNASASIKTALQNGTLDKYPDLKKDAESLFFTTSLQ